MDKDDKIQKDDTASEPNKVQDENVDLSAELDSLVDIDSTEVKKGDADLEKIGMTFVEPAPNKEDLSSLSEKMMKENALKELAQNQDKTATEDLKTLETKPAEMPKPEVKKEEVSVFKKVEPATVKDVESKMDVFDTDNLSSKESSVESNPENPFGTKKRASAEEDLVKDLPEIKTEEKADSSKDLDLDLDTETKSEIKDEIKIEVKKEEKPIEMTQQSIDELEKEFNQTMSTKDSVKPSSFNDKVSSLSLMLTKIKEKLGFKKSEVKEELQNLKKIKEDISEDIENIKELEESEDKIEAQLKKIEDMAGEISGIEKEVEQELKS